MKISSESGIDFREQLQYPEVTAADIRRDPPEVGGSKIILQRHERYQREERPGGALGSLTPESAKRAYNQTCQIVEEMLAPLSEDERKELFFLVVGSSTKFKNQGMRSMETAAEVLKALKDQLQERTLSTEQIINNRSVQKSVAPITKMQAPRFLDDSEAYLAFLREKYGDETQAFWKAFEEDTHNEERQSMEAEGPDEMDARFAAYVKTLANYAEHFHNDNPGKRLVVWAVSHYDTVSPYIKRHITKTDPHQYLPIDYGAGVSVEIDSKGNATTTFQGKEYSVDVRL